MPVRHLVRMGDCLASIAKQYGFVDPRVIYEHPDNAQLRERRPDPELLCPGDLVVVPDPRPRSVTLATERRHTIVVQQPRVVIKVRVVLDRPHHYELRAGHQVSTGTTDGRAPLEQRVPADLEDARLTLWPAEDGRDRRRASELELQLGQLQPADELLGIRQRLRNMGFLLATSEGAEGEADAIMRFQRSVGLEPSGVVDSPTRQRLVAEHDVV
jgi:hypothetical protein